MELFNRLFKGKQNIENERKAIEARQLLLVEALKSNLTGKDILASREESLEFYRKNTDITSDDDFDVPYGVTTIENPRIYLHPSLHTLLPEIQLAVTLEEAIHYSQIVHEGVTEFDWQHEISAKQRILKIASFLGLSEFRQSRLEEEVSIAREEVYREY